MKAVRIPSPREDLADLGLMIRATGTQVLSQAHRDEATAALGRLRMAFVEMPALLEIALAARALDAAKRARDDWQPGSPDGARVHFRLQAAWTHLRDALSDWTP